jgi:hypothetical protein
MLLGVPGRTLLIRCIECPDPANRCVKGISRRRRLAAVLLVAADAPRRHAGSPAGVESVARLRFAQRFDGFRFEETWLATTGASHVTVTAGPGRVTA